MNSTISDTNSSSTLDAEKQNQTDDGTVVQEDSSKCRVDPAQGWLAQNSATLAGCETDDGSSQTPSGSMNALALFKELGQNYSKKVLLDHIVTKDDCLKYGGRWFLPERNFDNILSSLAVLFEIITTEGWMELMYMGVDTNGVDMQPKRNARPYFAIYFISFIIIGNIFLLNLLVGIVID